jgi:hypothetical protein
MGERAGDLICGWAGGWVCLWEGKGESGLSMGRCIYGRYGVGVGTVRVMSRDLLFALSL